MNDPVFILEEESPGLPASWRETEGTANRAVISTPSRCAPLREIP